ncbi:hypothetical protein T069G_04210 [Trichoderma breve]|uniref:Uncharacterized protein n=1 Tax=Trichoderma breve TaxID=2034170 RepID=A0A9W9EAS4_9HYPO|nr:hypothetical protein T069G_04210 [Trichoderma breve]KAJ4863256.1 hypothetical protein T069G_04210 [Trichoderma breve]
MPDAIGNPTFGDHSEAQSIGPEAEQTTHTTRLGGANIASYIAGAPSAEFERPLLDFACGAATKPSSTSGTESTGSVAVQVGDFEITPEGETEEERVWRQWLG